MTAENNTPSLIQPLSAGNVVTAGLQLYRLNLKTYLQVAAIATAWILLPILVAILVVLFFAAVQNYYALLGLLIPAWLVLIVFCAARWMGVSASLTRLAFTELMQQPETVTTARRYTESRQWSFMLTNLLVGLLMSAVLTVCYIGAIIILVVVFLVFGGIGAFTSLASNPNATTLPNLAPFIAVFFAFLAVILMFVGVLSWFGVRFSIATVPLAVEPGVTAGDTIGRSWDLTQRAFWRLSLVFTVAILLTLPLNAMLQVLSIVIQGGVTALFPENVAAASLAYFLTLAISFAAGILLMPLWQAISAVIYYDLRSRREGLGLVILDRAEPVDRAALPVAAPSPLASRLFRQVTLATPESVDLEFTLAGVGNRALALVIDYSLLSLALLLFWIVGLLVSSQLIDYLERLDVDFSQAPLWLLAIAFLVSFAIYSGYFVFFETTRQGQTPGKRFTQTRVIRDNGRPVGLAQAAIRALLRPLDDFLFIGGALIWLGKQEKRIGDLAAGTLVIQENQPPSTARVEISDAAKSLALELPKTTQLSHLLPDDFAVVRAYLQRRRHFSTKARTELSLNLARQIRGIIHLETVPADLTSDCFLEAVYLAYQQQGTSG